MARTVLYHPHDAWPGIDQDNEETREFALEWVDTRLIAGCPRVYQDAIEEIQELFHIHGRISLYTDSLEGCRGKEYLITPSAWDGFWRKTFFPHVRVHVGSSDDEQSHAYAVKPIASVSRERDAQKSEADTPISAAVHVPQKADALVSHLDGISESSHRLKGPIVKSEPLDVPSEVQRYQDRVPRAMSPSQPASDSEVKNKEAKVQINISGPGDRRKGISVRPSKTIGFLLEKILPMWGLSSDEDWQLYLVPHTQDECGNLEVIGAMPCEPHETLAHVGGAYHKCEFVLEKRNAI